MPKKGLTTKSSNFYLRRPQAKILIFEVIVLSLGEKMPMGTLTKPNKIPADRVGRLLVLGQR